MVQTLPPDRSNQSLRIRILPRRLRGRQDFPHTHPSHSLAKRTRIDGVAIAQQIARSSVPREGLDNLLARPFRRGMGCNVEMNHSATMMSQNHKDKQHSKACSRYYEKVHRHQLLHVIAEKSTPSLGRWLALTGHVFGDGR